MIAALGERRCVEIKDWEGRDIERSRLERFALLAMHAACELTELDEWMWGWLGYVVEDLQEAPVPA